MSSKKFIEEFATWLLDLESESEKLLSQEPKTSIVNEVNAKILRNFILKWEEKGFPLEPFRLAKAYKDNKDYELPKMISFEKVSPSTEFLEEENKKLKRDNEYLCGMIENQQNKALVKYDSEWRLYRHRTRIFRTE